MDHLIDLSLFDKMNDSESLEYMTVIFLKMLIKKKFFKKEAYAELHERIGNLISCELMWQEQYDGNQDLMQYWPERN